MKKVTFPSFLKEAFYNDYKFSVIPCGRRVGKTYNSMQWLVLELLKNPDYSALWVDTRQQNIDAYYQRYFAPFLQKLGVPAKYNQQKKLLTFPNGSYMDFGSAERPENLEGFQYDRGVLNEAGIILKKNSLWDNTLRPMFKGDHVKVKIIGTSKGKNKFFDLYQMGKDPDEKEYNSYHYSVFDSPFWSHEELEKIRKRTPEEVWRQEYLAEFLDGAGSVFRNINQCIREPKHGLRVDVMAVDLAKHQDFTVITLGNKAEKQIISQDRFNQIDWGFQKKRIYDTWQHNDKPKVLIDSTGAGDPIFDDLKAAGMNIEGYKFTNESKKELIQGLSVAMDNAQIFYPNIPNLLSELEVFGYDITAAGNIRYNAPDGFHDDAVISLALANHLIKTSKAITLTWLD